MSDRSNINIGGGTNDLDAYSDSTSGAVVTWDTSTGLNKTLTIGEDFTLDLTNLLNGMSGDLRLDITSTTTITLPACFLNGSVTSLGTGLYHLIFVYDGTNLDINIFNWFFIPSLLTTIISGKTTTSFLGTGGNSIIGYENVQTYGMEYRISGETVWESTSLQAGPLAQSNWEETIGGLDDNTTYQYRAVMSINDIEYYGDVREDTTDEIILVVPTVITGTAANNTEPYDMVKPLEFNVVSNQVTSNGTSMVFQYGTVYSSTASSDADLKIGQPNVFYEITEGSINYWNDNITTGLDYNTLYYYRAFAENLTGTGYGEIKNNRTEILGGYGYLYNGFAISNPKFAPNNWKVPDMDDWDELVTYLGGDTVAGGHLKEVGGDHWALPNVDADNSSGFGGVASAYRSSNGAFGSNLTWSSWLWGYGGSYIGIVLQNYNGSANSITGSINASGNAVKLLWDGSGSPAYDNGYYMTDYNGTRYDVVLIGSQYWIALNWKCTKLNDGTPLIKGGADPNYLTDAEWAAATATDYYYTAYNSSEPNV